MLAKRVVLGSLTSRRVLIDMEEKGKFRFRKLDSIGAADADEDKLFLQTCFVNTGDLEALRDCSNPRRLVLGRTGSGKSALLIKLADVEERVIEVRPESLALSYISNSTVLQFFSELGVKLDIFFRLLWRHVFTVELLKYHFNINTEEEKESFVTKICNLFRDKKHTKAVDYLRKWGESFWEETEYRIKELTTKLEEDLRSAATSKIPHLSFTHEGVKKLSEEQKEEVIQRAQHVVNEVQIRQLSEILDLLNDVLADNQKRYFILIDRLDEDWIEDKLRFRLIRALIETVKDFGRVRNSKIIVAIRWDLLDRVFRLTRDGGFQEEKYESLYLPLQWNKDNLIQILELRINKLIQQRYTREHVTWRDVLPTKIGDESTMDYMLRRTMMRPRDFILFFNCCIQKAIDRPQITAQMVREAEGEYSRDRFRSLADEWIDDYPNLLRFASILRGQNKQFHLNELDDSECGNFCLSFLTDGNEHHDILSGLAEQVVNCGIEFVDFKASVMLIFYRVGLVGVKLRNSEAFTWSITGRRTLSRSEICADCRIAVHPAFYRVLGVRP